MATTRPPLSLVHHELRHGSVARVPLHLLHAMSEAIGNAIETSHESRRTHPIEGTSLELFADLSRVTEDFNACYIIVSGGSLASGKVQAGATLYTGVVANELATAPTGYRHVLRDYIAAAAAAKPHVTFSAFGPMPHEIPWTCGFFSEVTASLTANEKDAVLTVARLAAVQLAAKGQRARADAANAGRVPALDTREYPELL